MAIVHWLCLHSWGFPRRQADFEGQRDVDLQTCTKCGARRLSRVQFGPVAQVEVRG